MRAHDQEPDEDADDARYSVGQVAAMLHVPHAFLRRLDSEDVVIPARSEGGHRRYSGRQIVQLRQVQELVAEGLTLAGVRRVFALEARIAELEEMVRRAAHPAAEGRPAVRRRSNPR